MGELAHWGNWPTVLIFLFFVKNTKLITILEVGHEIVTICGTIKSESD